MHDPVESALNYESQKQEAWERELMEKHGVERTGGEWQGLTGAEVRQCRQHMQLTASALADQCGTKWRTVWNWEKNGVKGPAAKLILLLVRLHDLKPSYTLDDTDSPKAR